jgi:hypothetical protein
MAGDEDFAAILLNPRFDVTSADGADQGVVVADIRRVINDNPAQVLAQRG